MFPEVYVTAEQFRIKYHTDPVFRERERERQKSDKQKEARRSYVARRKVREPEYQNETQMKWKYKIGYTEYDKMYADQNGLCAICSRFCPARGKGRLNIDHSHTTNQVRQLLCSNCNKMLGLVYEDVNTLEQAKQYVLKWNTCETTRDDLNPHDNIPQES